MRKVIFILFASTIALVGCNKRGENNTQNYSLTSANISQVIADTIIYDVILRNIDTADVWQAECLQYLDQKSLINYLFDGVYSHQFTATEFMGNTALSIDEIKAIEQSEGFAREKVSKVQFKERWYIDSTGNFQKEIISYTIGIEVYSKKKSFLGHKALFVIRPKS